MPRFPVDEWQANLVRVTAFPAGTLPPPAEREWWQAVVGAAPEARSVKPRVGIMEESAPFATSGLPPGAARLVLGSSPSRIDWQLQPTVTPSPEVDFVGSLPVALRELLILVRRWLELDGAPPLQRIAVGATGMIPMPNRQDAYQTLRDYLPALTIDPFGSAELFYQINRPRDSMQVAGLRVNRLSKWQVTAMHMLPMVGGQAGRPITLNYLTLELDVNTAAERAEPIPFERRLPVLQELSALAVEIVEGGDLP